MLYEKYERRIKRQLTLLKLIKKYRILLMTLAVVSFSMVTGYSATKGLIYDVAIPNAFEYGETVQIRSSSLFSDVTYEYRSEGDTEWSKDQPVRAGKYEVRIITKQVFGSNNTKLYSFEIKPKKVDITLKDTLVLYGVDPTVNIDLVEGDRIDSIAFNYANMVQTSTTVTLSSIVIKDALGSDVTSSYELVFAPQTIAFTAREIKIRILDATQIYDGQILTSNDYEIVEGFLLEGHELQIIGSGSQTEVGISDNHIQSWKVMSGELDVSANYRIDEISGELEVTKRDITIETHSIQKTYDTTPLSTLEYTLIGTLVEGHTIRITSFSDISTVGIQDNILVIVIEDANGLDMTHNYNIEYQYGKLEIFKRTLVIETTGDQKVYDGKALTNTNFTLVSGELVSGHYFDVVNSSEIIFVGEMDNEITLNILDQNQNDVSDNYDIQMIYNTLMISRRNITLETRSTTAVYEGNPLQYGHFDLTQGTLVDGETFFVAGYTTERNVGIYENELNIQIQTNLGENRTINYAIEYIHGTIEITPKPIAVTTFNQTKVYDGTSLFEHGFSIEGLVLNHIGQVKTDTKLTLVGQTENILTLEIYEDTIDVTFNYQLSYIYGTLEVTKRAITVRPVIQTRIYDGTPLTSNAVESVYPNDLLEGHVLSATNFGSQTDVGTSINEILTLTITKESVDLTENYEITHETNTLTVTKRDITIETGSTTRIYDGEYLSNTNFEIFQGNLVLDHFGLVEIDTQILDVGSIDNTLSIEIYDGEGIKKSENYEILYVKGLLEILPRPITIRPEDVNKVYDGTPLTSSHVYSVIESDLLKDHKIVAITKGSQTIVGESKNSILDIQIWLDETNVTNNYEITTEIGYLTVTPRQIVIETYNNSKEYDGKYFYQHDYDIIEGDLAPNQTLWMQFDTQIKEVSVVDNILEFAVMDASNDNVTLNYEITYVYGTLEIYKRVITVIGIDKEKDYDGYALTSNEVKIIEGSLADNQKDDITLSGSITYVGTVQNPFDQVLIMEGLIDVTHNYDITTIEGTLTILPRYIKVLSHSVEEKVYDGTWLFEHNYTILSGSLADNEYTIVEGPSIKNVGTIENDIVLSIFNSEDFETTFNYEIEYVYGILEIIPRPITYLTASDSKVYDDTPLFNTTTKVILGSLVEGHTDLVDKFEDITDVGTIDNLITVLIFDELGEDVTTNYDIKYELGTLTIEPRPITIQSKSADKEYDGLVFSYPEFTIIGEIVFSHTVEVVFSMEATDAGEYVNIIKIKILNKDGVNKTDNYKIEEDFGTLTIHLRKIQIETATNSFVYDGFEHFDESYTILSGSVVLDHMLVVIKNTPITNALEIPNTLHFIVIDGNQIDQSHNYELIITEGTLTVTPRPIYFESESSSQEFNGEPFFHPVAHLVTGNLVLDHHYYDYNYATITNVGETDNLYEITIYDGMGIDVSDNYEIHKSSGILEVTPRPITVFTKSNTHIYDATPFSDTELEYTNLIDTHHLEIVTYAEIINVGTILNEIIVVVLDELNQDVTNNYTISYDYGTLEVLKKAITIQPTFETKEYDGTPLTSNTLMSVVLSDLIKGHKLEGITEGSITNVGTTINHLLEVRILQDEVDVTENYDITYLDGTLEITKRYVEVTTASETKVYDGLPLINSNYGISSGSLVLDHIFILEYAPSITNAGFIPNELTIAIMNTLNEDVSSNYDISYQYGKLEVKPRPITIKTASSEKMYDATPLFNLNYDLIDGTLLNGHFLVIDDYIEIINVSEIDNIILIKVYTLQNEDVSQNYVITYNYGTLKITPRPITILTGSDTKIYDDTPLYNDEFSLIEGSLISGHFFEVVDYVTITDVGVINNRLDLIIKDEILQYVTGNYAITYIYGTLEITPRWIHFETASDIKEYDGTALFNKGFTILSDPQVFGHIISVVEYTQITNIGSVNNELTFMIKDIKGNVKTHNYALQFSYGNLSVTPRNITIKPKDITTEYTGTTVYTDEFEIVSGSLLSGHVLDVILSTEQQDVGVGTTTIDSATVWFGFMDVTDNYNITLQTGTIEIEKLAFVIQPQNASKVYDGLPLTSNVVINPTNDLPENHTIEAVTFGSQTEIGYSINTIVSVTIWFEGRDVTDNFDLVINTGLLEVTGIPIEIATANSKKVYDGSPLTKDGWALTKGSLLPGHTLEVFVIGSITEVGTTFNDIIYRIVNEHGDVVTNQYVVSENLGKLRVTSPFEPIQILSGSDSKDYDGLPLTFDHWSLIKGKLAPGHRIEAEVTGEIVNVGTAPNTFTYVILDANGNDVTGQYEIETIEGLLVIFNPEDNGENGKSKFDISTRGEGESDGSGTPLFRVYSPITDNIYLRERSYGDYNKTGFNSPEVYFSPYNLSPLSFTGLAINNALTSYTIQIKAIVSGLSYMSPYYGLDNYLNNYNDTYISQKFGSGYTANYVPIGDVDPTAYTLENTMYSEQESVYKEFVYNTYLQLPADTKAAMLRIASLNGLNPTNPNIIQEVKNYIQSAAIYSLEFRPFPANVDFAVYFLEVLREGICQHFAMAATTMYRALGIPARYVVGYSVIVKEANQWVDVGVDRAHAWVEVYVDGFGWVPMEVTAGGAGGSVGSGNGSGGSELPKLLPGGGAECPTNEPCDDLELIEVRTGNASKYYDGTPLTNDLVYYNGRLKAGHSIEFTITGSITQVGETRNAFTFKIVDDDGTDVTSQYRTRKVEGLLVVVPNNSLPIIELQVYDVKKVYNATTFTHSDDEFWVVSDNLPLGYRVELDIKGEVSIAGFLETYISRGSVRIYNAQDVDVTSQFNIVTYYGSIEVLKRSITVNGYTIQKDYDGTPLTSDAYYISRGSLVAGHTMTVTMEGSITNVGTADNKVGSVIILDQDGNDVTENYKITKVKGQLIVTD